MIDSFINAQFGAYLSFSVLLISASFHRRDARETGFFLSGIILIITIVYTTGVMLWQR